jgi:hypothetical protein
MASSVTDLASLCAASGLALEQICDASPQDLQELFDDYKIKGATKIKIKGALEYGPRGPAGVRRISIPDWLLQNGLDEVAGLQVWTRAPQNLYAQGIIRLPG